MRNYSLAIALALLPSIGAAQTPHSAPKQTPPPAGPDYPLPSFPAPAPSPAFPKPYVPGDPDQLATPNNNPGMWVNSNDYPSVALRYELEGRTQFDLVIGPDGRASACAVTQSSGAQILDDVTCRNVMRRARFNPATNAKGQPISGAYTKGVQWVIPGGTGYIPAIGQEVKSPLPLTPPAGWIANNVWAVPATTPLKPDETIFTVPRLYMLTISSTGAVTQCLAKARGFNPIQQIKAANPDKQICAQYSGNARFAPAKNANGDAISGVYVAHIPEQEIRQYPK